MFKFYANYLLKKSLKSYDKIYDKFSGTRNYFWKDSSFLLDYITEGDVLLDNGCGNGRLYAGLEGRDVKYIGIDNCLGLLNVAKERYGDKFLYASALSLPFVSSFFDKVFSIAVIHHIPSIEYRKLFLREMYRVLKKGGLCCITSWNNVSKKYKPCLHKLYLDDGDYFVPFKNERGELMGTRYVHVFDVLELEELVLEAGFQVIDKGITEINGRKRNIYFVLRK